MNQRTAQILRESAILGLLIAIISIVAGFLTMSQMILFDGIYSLTSVGLTYISITAYRFIDKEDAKQYPFGKATLEPIIVIVQYGVLLILSLANIFTAIQTVLSGGRVPEAGIGAIYALFATIFCLIVFRRFTARSQQEPAALALAEIIQWKFSAVFSFVVFIGFTLAAILARSAFAAIVPYIDSIMVISITSFFIKKPLSEIITAIKELLSSAPPAELQEQVEHLLLPIMQRIVIEEYVLRLAKIGGQLVVEIDLIVTPDSELDRVLRQDALRAEITAALADVPYETWLTLTCTADKKWAI